MLPGLHDMHVHPLMAGQTQLQCMFPQGSTEAAVVEAVRKCASAHGKGEWIVGGQWDTASLGAHPDWKALDKAAPDNPVALTDISLHGLWVNSAALRLANITAATANPPGGVIEKDAKGEPTGVLRESAGALVRTHIPAYTLEQNAKALSWSMKLMMSYGITSYTDALVDEGALKAYALLADRGELKQRVKACLVWGRSLLTAGDAPQTDYITLRNLYVRERFSPSCIKILLDGVPTDGHTAAMVEQYADAKSADDPRAKGLLMVPAAELRKALINFDAQGFTVKMHAAGDGAVRAGLDAMPSWFQGPTGPLYPPSIPGSRSKLWSRDSRPGVARRSWVRRKRLPWRRPSTSSRSTQPAKWAIAPRWVPWNAACSPTSLFLTVILTAFQSSRSTTPR